jgi:hypothetical protein
MLFESISGYILINTLMGIVFGGEKQINSFSGKEYMSDL